MAGCGGLNVGSLLWNPPNDVWNVRHGVGLPAWARGLAGVGAAFGPEVEVDAAAEAAAPADLLGGADAAAAAPDAGAPPTMAETLARRERLSMVRLFVRARAPGQGLRRQQGHKVRWLPSCCKVRFPGKRASEQRIRLAR